MAKKLFYLIRHGESLLNAAHVRQGPEGALSPRGVEQADRTGKALSPIKFDAFLVSPYERTRETAQIIAKHVHTEKPIEYVDLLMERRNPSEIVNKHAEDPQVKYIIDLIDKSYHDDNYRYSDEENFTDLKERARRLLIYLAHRPENKILVVTHSIFLKMIASYILYRDDLTAKKYNLLSYTNTSSNASVTIIEYTSSIFGDGWLGRQILPPERRWRLLEWDKQ